MGAINYPEIMAEAFREMIGKVLKVVEKEGLSSPNYFMISFHTRHKGVVIADWLLNEHPNEMQIVIQHWFENLRVHKGGFWITLNFSNETETLYIPYSAITAFADPGAGVEFSLLPLIVQSKAFGSEKKKAKKKKSPAKVVSLDSFRKK